jgi:putative RecB family exonuclease
MVLGRAVHQAIAEYHLSLQNKKPLAEGELQGHLDAAVDQEGRCEIPIDFKNGEDLDQLRTVGRQLVELYQQEAQPRNILAVEQAFRAKLTDPETGKELDVCLVGVFDLIEEDDEGTVSVVEIKTAARRWSAGQVDLDLQTSVYAEAVVQAGLAPEGEDVAIRYDILVKNKKPVLDRQFAVRRPGDRKMAMTIAVHVLKAIERDAFYRNPGWQCSGCQYRKQCGI